MVYTCRAGADADANAETISSGCCWLVGPSELGGAAGYSDVPVAPATGSDERAGPGLRDSEEVKRWGGLGSARALCLPQLLALCPSYAKLPARTLPAASFAVWTLHFLGVTPCLMKPTD